MLTSITGDLIFEPFWEAIYRLEQVFYYVSALVQSYAEKKRRQDKKRKEEKRAWCEGSDIGIIS